ncbi:MAG: NADH-quinone oxidoreductase subunit J [Candidatus Omnitrophica bacterium]|nr:NADH-quinone oxidoreductase subunit J [Candidatus Omnitrophota bacterium]
MLTPITFYAVTTLMIASALGVILARQPIYAVLSLVVTLGAMAALFVLLGAFFVAAIQVLVYAGAIMVLFLFVVMLLDLSPEVAHRARRQTLRGVGGALGLLFLVKLWHALRSLPGATTDLAAAAPLDGTTRAIGLRLFTTHGLPFELASVLVLVGVIGAIVLAKRTLD